MTYDLDWLERDPALTLSTPAYVETPLGSMLLLSSSEALLLCGFIDQSDALLGWMASNLVVSGPLLAGAEHPVLAQAQRFLTSYFSGSSSGRAPGLAALLPERAALPPLDLRGTDFQRAVWQAVQQVPAGTTLSYTDLSRELGRSVHSAAVARALSSTPLQLFVPCHRVIGGPAGEDGEAGETWYPGGAARRSWLLRHERQPGLPPAPWTWPSSASHAGIPDLTALVELAP